MKRKRGQPSNNPRKRKKSRKYKPYVKPAKIEYDSEVEPDTYDIATGKYQNNKPLTPGHRAGKTAAIGSGAALGYIAGNVPGAWNGGVLANRAYDYTYQDDLGLQKVDSDGNPVFQTKSINFQMPPYGYAGKLPKSKKSKYTKMDYALAKGGVAVTENFGQVADPHCVYLIHSTYQFDSMSFAVRYAILRKLFVVGGYNVANNFEELPLFNYTNSDGFKVTYLYNNSVTGITTDVEYTIVNNQTLTDVCNSFTGFKSAIDEWMKHDMGKEPYRILLYASDRNGLDTNWRFVSLVNIADEVMTMHAYSEIKIQNRTSADTGTSKAIDLVDNQPCVCTLFDFKNADVRVRTSRNALSGLTNVLNGTPLNTVKLLRAGSQAVPREFGNEDDFQNTPSKSLFNNCIGTSKSVLQPGQMKSSKIFYSCSGRGLNFFKKIQMQSESNSNAMGLYGKAQMLVVEEKMRTIGTNSVTIHYERAYKVAFTSVTKKGTYIQPSFSSLETNLV